MRVHAEKILQGVAFGIRKAVGGYSLHRIWVLVMT